MPVLFGALLVLGVTSTTLGLLPGDGTRAFAERFANGLDGPPETPLDAYLAPDAQVFLQGATTALSPQQFHVYLDNLRRSRHAFHAATPVYLTQDGAGWLLDIKNLSETALVNPPGIESPPQLWMQARIDQGRITRLWIHFTVEALERLHIRADVYRASAEGRDLPLPQGWEDGTAAMVQAAERGDPRAAGAWSESARRALIFAAWAPLLVSLVTACVRLTARNSKPARVSSGRMLASLRRMRSAAPAGDLSDR